MKITLPQIAPSQYTVQTLDALFARPVFKSIDFAASTGMARRSDTRILTALCDNGVLKVVREARGRKPAVLAFAELIAITEGRFDV
jgi:hypothetical protein